MILKGILKKIGSKGVDYIWLRNRANGGVKANIVTNLRIPQNASDFLVN